jgi:DNA-binding MarR family transcriptional regulator
MRSRAVRPSLAELRQVADKLLLWFNEIKQDVIDEAGKVEESKHRETLSALALSKYRVRRMREEYFPQQLFGEPAWDILLDLYISNGMDRKISVSSLCVASMVPPTTALRYISMLEDNGMLRKVPAESDRRVSLVELTEEGCRAMDAYLTNVGSEVVNLLAEQRKNAG